MNQKPDHCSQEEWDNGHMIIDELNAWFKKAKELGFYIDLKLEKYYEMIKSSDGRPIGGIPFDDRIPNNLIYTYSKP